MHEHNSSKTCPHRHGLVEEGLEPSLCGSRLEPVVEVGPGGEQRKIWKRLECSCCGRVFPDRDQVAARNMGTAYQTLVLEGNLPPSAVGNNTTRHQPKTPQEVGDRLRSQRSEKRREAQQAAAGAAAG
jgi:hypothetical protein